MKKDLLVLATIRGLILAIIENGHFDRSVIELHKVYELLNGIIKDKLENMKQEEIESEISKFN